MFHASIFGLIMILQCGTTAAAAIAITICTPTVGLGCCSLGYITHGATAIIIMLLNIISTISARISETREERSPEVKALTKFIAIALRRIRFLLALINRTGLILLSCLQFTNHLDSCYCNASVIGCGTDSYMIIFYNGSVTTMRNSRIGGTILSGVTMGVYIISFGSRVYYRPTPVTSSILFILPFVNFIHPCTDVHYGCIFGMCPFDPEYIYHMPFLWCAPKLLRRKRLKTIILPF